ncbi:MAG TPA: roadblock/LC7 domain-containing protein [Thermoplasmata archaeon]|jgi:predicted regulator of Ras-like GTPase activity (Roadblock/LC7/MglB family)
MSLDAGPRLQAVLAELRRVPDILGATIARRDGILIASALAKSMDPRKIAAMAAAIVGTSEMAATEMGLGVFNQSIVDTHIGKLLATGAGEEAILITMVRNDANMGLVLLSVDRAVQSIAAILDAESEVSAEATV